MYVDSLVENQISYLTVVKCCSPGNTVAVKFCVEIWELSGEDVVVKQTLLRIFSFVYQFDLFGLQIMMLILDKLFWQLTAVNYLFTLVHES